LVGVVVDGISGAALDHCPNPVRITLRPLPAGRARHTPAGFSFDPVATCKAQTEAKYATPEPRSNTPSH